MNNDFFFLNDALNRTLDSSHYRRINNYNGFKNSHDHYSINSNGFYSWRFKMMNYYLFGFKV